MILPLLFNEMYDLYNNSIKYINNNNYLSNILNNVYNRFSKDIFNIVSKSINTISNIFITAFLAFYMLCIMDKIKELLKSTKYYNYLKVINKELNNYIDGFIKIMGITFIEYIFFYSIIGHPNNILLGILASTANLIPFFGSMFTNILAILTSLLVSKDLFIKTIIIGIVASLIDSYIINPYVYGKTSNLSPLVVIISIYISSTILGMEGLLIALPLSIIIITTYKYYKNMI